MNRWLIYSLVAILTGTSMGCSEWLQLEPESQLTREEFWQSGDDVEAVVAGTYKELAGMVDNFVSSDGSIYEIGPAPVSIQYFLINWLLDKVGWKPSPLNAQYPTKELTGGGILISVCREQKMFLGVKLLCLYIQQ